MTILAEDGISPAAGFPEATREQWRDLVSAVLRKAGKDLAGPEAEQALATELDGGVTVLPLYTAQDADGPEADPGVPGLPPYVRGNRPLGGWDVRQRHRLADAAATNEAVLADLENGASSLWLSVGGTGLPVADLGAALAGVHLDLAPVVLDAGPETGAAARALLDLHERQGVDPAAVAGNLGADPLGHAARTGTVPDLADALALAELAHRTHPALRALTADMLPYHEAGASDVQELGLALATGVAYLRELTGAGLGLRAAFGQLEFRYAATADQFLTLAKLRAARRLWARVAEASGVPAAGGQRQHAVTSPVMMTRRDPYVNMLRTTLAAFAAGLGGADAVTVLPFDDALGRPDALARRIARNTSSVLLEESRLGQVADPAGGSWYVERLTGELARAGWDFFQEVEAAGGQPAALASGMVAERLAAAWRTRSRRLATRSEAVTGVSEYPHLAEEPLVREPVPAQPSGGLPRVRRDEAYEALRARSDAHLAATGTRPAVFLAALGPAAAHTARASFASQLLQAGGVLPVHDPAAVDADTVAAAFAAAGTDQACLCSSDALYAEQGPAVLAALRAAGARWVYLAGRPGTLPGIDDHLRLGCDAPGTLARVLDRAGCAKGSEAL